MASAVEPIPDNEILYPDHHAASDAIPLIRVFPEEDVEDGLMNHAQHSHRLLTWPMIRHNGPNIIYEKHGNQKDQSSSGATYEPLSDDDSPEKITKTLPRIVLLCQELGKFVKQLRPLHMLSVWNCDTWRVEWAALFCSFISFGAIVGILCLYRGHVSSTRVLGLHINPWVSGLSTVLKTLMMFCVGSAIGQHKWLWFRRKRALSSLDEFDAATRDPKGAFNFLYKYSSSSVASLGSLLTILALAIDFSLQNAVSLEVIDFEIVGYASTNRLQTLKTTSVQSPSGKYGFNPLFSPLMTQALYEGIFGSPLLPNVVCPTGNCTFDDSIASLSVCSLCQDVSNHVTNYMDKYNNTYSRLPNGLELHISSSSMNSNILGPKNTPYTNGIFVATTNSPLSAGFPISHGMVNFSALSFNESYECSLFMCVNEYQISVEKGMVSESVTRTWNSNFSETVASESSSDAYYLTFVLPQAEYNEAETSNSTFSISKSQYLDLQAFLKSSLSGELEEGSPTTAPIIDALANYDTVDVSSPDNLVYLDLSHIPALLSNLTRSISVGLRQTSSAEAIQGNVLWTDTFIHVVWYWLIFPFTLLLLSFIFLMATVRKTQQDKIRTWKSSMLPLIFHGLSSKYKHEVEVVEEVSAMERKAEDLKVELMETEEGWKFV